MKVSLFRKGINRVKAIKISSPVLFGILVCSLIYSASGQWVQTNGSVALAANDPFADYEWVDELANRSVNTDYVNDTGYTLFYGATRQSNTSGALRQANITAVVDGVVIAMNTYIDRNNATGQAGIGAIPVPPGSTYRMNSTSGSSLIDWAEFKKKVT